MDLELPLGKRTAFYRFFEILPFVSSLFIITLPVTLSLLHPLAGAIFVIVYIIIWLVKAIAMAIRSIQGFSALRSATRLDWTLRLNELTDPASALEAAAHRQGWRIKEHRNNLARLAAMPDAKKPADISQLVIIPTYNESYDVLAPTLTSLLDSTYDAKQMFVAIAYEERGGPDTEANVRRLEREFGSKFKEFYAIKHPADLPDEVMGKGANITYAGEHLWNILEKRGVDPETVIVTTMDADNRPHRSYFTAVTYEYLTAISPRHISLQPMSLYLNNIWDVPAAMRVLATGNSMWNIVISQRPHALRNFAAHSQSLAALIDMNFWSKRTIVEDGHQFWRSYFRYDGDYSVTPIYVPIYQDAVLADKYTRTLKAQFVQNRRWAYGASDIPYVAERVFTKKRTVPFWSGFAKFARLFDSHVSWSSASFILMLGAFAPLVISPLAGRSIVAHQLPNTASIIQQIALFGLAVNVIVFFKMLPPRPKRYSWTRSVAMVLQWILTPILGIIYSSAAALSSQYRLATGKYLDKFAVTEKHVVRDEQ